MDGGLKQDDFRKLLATPRPGAQQQPLKTAPPKPKEPPKAKDGEFQKPEPRPPRPKKQWKRNEAEEDASSASYRDRAKERRKGVNPDYEESEQILKVLSTSNPDASTAGLSYEQSKYLGGDIEHTHLVKGLDFALLERVRKGIDTEEKKKEEEGNIPDDDEAAAAYVAALHGDDGPITFQSALAESVHRIATAPQTEHPKVNELFIAGRMTFVWELGFASDGEYIGSPDIPTTVIRSKSDVRDTEQKLASRTSSNMVVEKVAQVVEYIRSRSGGNMEKKRIKKSEKLKRKAEGGNNDDESDPLKPDSKRSAAPSHLDDDDDDIFADAGVDYVLTVDKEKKPSIAGPMLHAVNHPDDNDSVEGPALGPGMMGDVVGPARPDGVTMGYPEVDGYPEVEGYPEVDGYPEMEGYPEEVAYPEVEGYPGVGAYPEAEDIQGYPEVEDLMDLDDKGGPSKPEELISDILQLAAESSTQARGSGSLRNLEASSSKKLPVYDAYEDAMMDMVDLDESGSDKDEEPDFNQMDMGTRQNKRRQMTRFDFDTEEEWGRYKDTQVHLPKAAFQFGIKSKDSDQLPAKSAKRGGRGGKRGGSGRIDVASKVNRDMEQLDAIMKKKYGKSLMEKEDVDGGRPRGGGSGRTKRQRKE
ncbi:RED-like protein N-terminal region-domain-containing protein [Cladochytrium replicatum]|nr:RED-like protein N-terminal region-domain-containing protein [Cladochytrium replicatum]